MKQLTCEMCGSTELIKKDGVFVCQTCGTKYSVEEAKKMMVEVDGAIVVQNAAQIENLLNLAQSSYDSENFSQAEKFCNQVISMDDKNYKAWKLKGEAINFQINAQNQRILEVYNCIMTSYEVLNEEQKEEKKHEILSSLKICFEGEIVFWLNQFEANRPTDNALARVKKAYEDSYDKIKTSFETMGFSDQDKENYLIKFDNFFILNCNNICTSAWETTVGYNYYRDKMSKLSHETDPFDNNDGWIIRDTDIYRPTDDTWDTFLRETDNLIQLLEFAQEKFNSKTEFELKKALYEDIIYFEEHVIPSGSWHITQGYAYSGAKYEDVGWGKHYKLAETAKNARELIILRYKNRIHDMEIEAKEEKRKVYWEAHAEEKVKLDKEQEELEKKINELDTQIVAVDKKIDELSKERDNKLPCEIEVDKQRDLIRDLEAQKDKCGILNRKEKKAIQVRLNSEEYPKLDALLKNADAEKKVHQEKYNAKINTLKGESEKLNDEMSRLVERSDEIFFELNKNR